MKSGRGGAMCEERWPGPAVMSATVWSRGCCTLKGRMNVRCFEGSMDEIG